jgi:hypothetical protein
MAAPTPTSDPPATTVTRGEGDRFVTSAGGPPPLGTFTAGATVGVGGGEALADGVGDGLNVASAGQARSSRVAPASSISRTKSVESSSRNISASDQVNVACADGPLSMNTDAPAGSDPIGVRSNVSSVVGWLTSCQPDRSCASGPSFSISTTSGVELQSRSAIFISAAAAGAAIAVGSFSDTTIRTARDPAARPAQSSQNAKIASLAIRPVLNHLRRPLVLN